MEVPHLAHVRVLGKNERYGDVRFIQLAPEAVDAAGAGDAGPRHAQDLQQRLILSKNEASS